MGWINKVDKREAILAAADTCLRARGLHQVKIRDIAKTAGVSLGSVHYYFPSKEHILMELFRQFVRRVSQATGSSPVEADPRQRLQDFWEAFFRELTRDPETAQIFAGLWDGALENKELADLLARYYRKFLDWLTALLEEGRDQGLFQIADAEAAAVLIVAIIDGIKVQLTLPGPPLDLARLQSAGLDLVGKALGINRPQGGDSWSPKKKS